MSLLIDGSQASSKRNSKNASATKVNLQKVPNYSEPPVRSEAALKRIGVTKEQLRVTLPIHKILKEDCGGIAVVIESMRFSQQEIVLSFLEKYDSLSERDRESLPLEAIALYAEIEPRVLWGEIMLSMREKSVNSVKIIAVAAHPQIMRTRVAQAQTPGGYRDRDALDTMLGALPSPKGPTFIGKAFFGGSTPEPDDPDDKPEQVPEELVSDENFVFPDCEVMQEKVQPMRKLLDTKR